MDTEEYRRSNAASAANAIAAYQDGATGKGVKIAVIDSGITPTLSEFSGRIDPASADMAGNRGMADEWGHGTAVAAVAAAAKDDSATHGVAFESTIVALRVDQPGTCAAGNCVYGWDAVTAALDAARLAGAKVINMSIVGSTPPQHLIDAIGRAVSAGIVVVICAGNDSSADPGMFASAPAAQFPGMIIIAGSIGVDNGSGGINLDQISTFSNRAGAFASVYLAALGYNVNTIGADGSLQQWWGTSFAAPTISGAAALLFHAFPNLTAKDVMDILFRSADDLGAAGVDVVFGHGRLNIAREFLPIGTTTLAGSGVPVGLANNGVLPAAAGDGGTGRSFGAVILDGYSRAFVLNLAAALRQAQRNQPLAQAIRLDQLFGRQDAHRRLCLRCDQVGPAGQWRPPWLSDCPAAQGLGRRISNAAADGL
jgi:subtilisin family serine protease